MKKTLTLTTLTLLAGAVSAYSQGSLTLLDYNGGFCIQVFGPQSSTAISAPATASQVSGAEVLGGVTSNTYSTSPGSATYKSGTSAGTGYDVQLLIGAGSGDSLASLSTAGPIVTSWYRAPGNNTQFGGIWSTTANVNFGTAAEAVTVAIAAWNSEGGTINSLSAALAGDPGGVGFSNTGNLTLGGGQVAPVALPSSLESFSLVPVTSTPEPSTIALGVIGASTLLFRRKK